MKSLNKKGFTLIEMLITITIVAIVLIISTSKFTFAIPEAKNELYAQEVESLKKAAALYVADNKYSDEITSKIGNSCIKGNEVIIDISISSLIDSGYIKQSDNLSLEDEKNVIKAYYNCQKKQIIDYDIVPKEEEKHSVILESPSATFTPNCESNKTININNKIVDDNGISLIKEPVYFLKISPNAYTKKSITITNKTNGMNLFSCGKNNNPENCNPTVVTNFSNEEMWYKIVFNDKTISNYSFTTKDNLDFVAGISDGINYQYSEEYNLNSMDNIETILPSVVSIKEYTNGFNINIDKSNSQMSCGVSTYGISVSPVKKSKLNEFLNLECYTPDALHNNIKYSGNTSNLMITSISHGSNSLVDFIHYDYCYSICMQNSMNEKACTSKTTNNVVTLKELSAPSVSSSVVNGKKKVTINFDNNILLDSNTSLYVYSSSAATSNISMKKCLIGKTLCSSNSSSIAKSKWYKLNSTKSVTLTYSSTSSVSIKTYTDDGDNTLSNSFTK